jgi:histone acetyltransferase HTATIP
MVEEGPSISAGGTYTLEEVVVGSKLFVKKPDVVTGEIEERKAEILSIREKPKARNLRAQLNGEKKDESERAAEDRLEYYVHYSEFNKRLDEWVSGSRLIITRDLEWPKAGNVGSGGHGHGHANGTSSVNRKKISRTNSGAITPGTPSSTQKAAGSNLLRKAALQAQASVVGDTASPSAVTKRKEGDDEDVSMSGTDAATPGTPGEDGAVVPMEMLGEDTQDVGEDTLEAEAAAQALHPNRRTEVFSKEQEIEKLRTSGSMTQSVSEVARVKNINKIQMGKHEVDAWYFSPYPIEYTHCECLYICEMCLSFFPSSFTLKRHRAKCTMLHPPGNEIYRHEDVSFFEIDGRRQKVWCRNLCLLSKCFLDHKTLYYDTDPFLFYVMAQRDDSGAHTIGYFSKEKESAENYNVACILTLPQHQRTGIGRLLIEFSYELSKREHKLGSPEKPLSDLGLLGYRAYWAETIVELLLRSEEDISIEDIANRTSIVHSDILHTCQALNMLKQYQGKHFLVLNDQVLAKHDRQMKKRRRRIHPEHLHWQPPKFSRDQLRQLLY